MRALYRGEICVAKEVIKDGYIRVSTLHGEPLFYLVRNRKSKKLFRHLARFLASAIDEDFFNSDHPAFFNMFIYGEKRYNRYALNRENFKVTSGDRKNGCSGYHDDSRPMRKYSRRLFEE